MLKKINRKRYKLNIEYNNLPKNIVIFNDNTNISKDFYTLQEIAKYLGVSYAIVRGIYKNINKGHQNLFCPTIKITDIQLL